MSIFLNADCHIIIQGITGSEGSEHTRRILASGTQLVGGTNPRKAGQTVLINNQELPVFGTVAATVEATGADATVILYHQPLLKTPSLKLLMPIFRFVRLLQREFRCAILQSLVLCPKGG